MVPGSRRGSWRRALGSGWITTARGNGGVSLLGCSVKILSRTPAQGDLLSRVTFGLAGNVLLFSSDTSHRMRLILTLLQLESFIWLQTTVTLWLVCLRQMC